METTVSFQFDEIGQRSGKSFTGKFQIKSVLSRREHFLADERRRFILGPNPAGAPPSLQGEAYMLGRLYVLISDGPEWWMNSDGGLDIADENVIGELYRLAEEKVKEKEEELAAQAKAALTKLASRTSKKSASQSQADKEE